MDTRTRTSRTGFTVPELIVVISVAVILLGSLAPALSLLRHSTQEQAAINTIGVAVTAARAYATVNTTDLQDADPIAYPGLRYSGTAILFTPAGELRLVTSDQLAENNGNTRLQEIPPPPTDNGPRNGYKDIDDRDYIKLPRDVGVLGIGRIGRLPRDELLLLTPPFAVRFDPNGGLIAGQLSSSPERVVQYDGNYNGKYTTTPTASTGKRPNGYNPDPWDPNSPAYTNKWDSTVDKYRLPFEIIETVVGVVVYSKNELRQAGLTHDAANTDGNPINVPAGDWILENGTVLLFSRYSGALIKLPKP